MYVRTMPTVSFKQTKKILAKKNNQYYYSGHRSKTHAAQLLNKLTAMHAPAEMPKSEGEPRKTAAATDKARKKPEWVRTLQVRWLTSNALTQMA